MTRRRLARRAELFDVWGGTVVSERAVRSHLHELRRGDGVIETVIGRRVDLGETPAEVPREVVRRSIARALLA